MENNPVRAPHRSEGAVANPDALVAIDDQQRVTAWNQAAEEMFGWKAAEMIGRPVIELFERNTYQLQRAGEMLAELTASGHCHAELVITKRNGTAQLIEIDGVHLYDAQTGRPSGAAAIIRDISLRRMMQNGLKANEQRLRAVLEHMPVGVWLIDSKGQIVMGNRAGQLIWAGARFVGLEHYGEYRARNLATGKLLKAEDWAGYRAVTYGETTLNELLEIECFDGSVKIIRNSCLPFFEDGEMLGAVVVNEDITDLRKAQEELNRLRSDSPSAQA